MHIHVQKIWIVNWIFEENKIRYVVTHITQVHNQVHTCYQFFEHIFFVFDWESKSDITVYFTKKQNNLSFFFNPNRNGGLDIARKRQLLIITYTLYLLFLFYFRSTASQFLQFLTKLHQNSSQNKNIQSCA